MLQVEPAANAFQAPDPVVLRAHFEEEGERIQARRIHGLVRDAHGKRVAELLFRDDGRAGDGAAGDRRYTARLASDEARGFSGAYLVQVEAVATDGTRRAATTGFLYGRPLARLTGFFRDARVEGSLRVEAQVEVFEGSRFHLEATLGSREGDPLAWAQHAATLEPGLHWMPLTFYGLALFESGVDGPYRLLSVALTTTGRMPNIPHALRRDAHRTAAYAAEDFTHEPFEGSEGARPEDPLRHLELDPSRLEADPP